MRKERGFTLIEVLVVVSILGVLMGLISVLVIKSASHQKKFQTRTLIKSRLSTVIETWRQQFERLPPMTVQDLTGRSQRWKGLTLADNTTNECNEVLLVALRHPDFTTPLTGDDLNLEEPFGNTDDDSWNEQPAGSPTADAREILDAWGNPIVYIQKNAYGETVTIVRGDGQEVEVVARKRPDGTYYNPTKFQLISLGPNGVQDLETPEGGDDIMNFKLEEE